MIGSFVIKSKFTLEMSKTFYKTEPILHLFSFIGENYYVWLFNLYVTDKLKRRLMTGAHLVKNLNAYL